jgi:hypothetical protein
MRTWDDLAASTNPTQADRNLLIAIIAPDLDTLEKINLGNAFTYEIMLIAAHRQSAADYWYRQGKDDGVQMERQNIVGWLRFGLDDWPDYVSPADIAVAIEAGEHLK